MRIYFIGLIMLVTGRSYAENGCFHSVGEAALRAGVRDEGGFRAEGVRRDVFSGVEWVRVARCGRPDLPETLVRGLDGVKVPNAKPFQQPANAARPAVLAGDTVRLVWEEGAARGELRGVATASGVVGARIKIRIEGFATAAPERMVDGVVRSTGVVELVPALEASR